MSATEPWAQLVSTTDILVEPILICAPKFGIGRSPDADLSLSGNKLVSGSHCCIIKTANGCEIVDSSTNGTLLNLKEKVHGKSAVLQHGDEFHIVYRKTEPNLNVGFLFQDLSILRAEEEDATLEYSSSLPDVRLSSDAEDDSVVCSNDPIPSDQREANQKISCNEEIGNLDPPRKKVKLSNSSNSRDEGTDSNSRSDWKELKNSQNDDACDKKLLDDSTTKDAIEETLICCICQELLHNCVSLQPCMHSFCAGCYSDWMKRSNECPTCRMVVERINKNHIVNNLVEAYLLSHPDKKRPDEDLKELDEKNTITADMMKPSHQKAKSDNSSESSCSDDDDDYSSDSSSDSPAPFTTSPITFPLYNLNGGAVRPPKTVCRECAEYKEAGGVANAGVAVTVGGKGNGCVGAGAHRFVCEANQVHILCQCCLNPMPDRRTARARDENIPMQQCCMCFRTFCNLYWGCRKAGCLGCIAKFKDIAFGEMCLHHLILDNQHESAILSTYMKEAGVTVGDLLDYCTKQLDAGKYTCQDSLRQLTSDSVVCYPCALRNFKDLAYQYRKEIPRDSLPCKLDSYNVHREF